MQSAPTALRLRVNRTEFAHAVRIVQAAESEARHRATICFADGVLAITMGEVTGFAHGSGTWSGEVRLLASDFKRLFINTDAGPEFVDVGMDNERGFYAGGISARCTWRPGPPRMRQQGSPKKPGRRW